MEYEDHEVMEEEDPFLTYERKRRGFGPMLMEQEVRAPREDAFGRTPLAPPPAPLQESRGIPLGGAVHPTFPRQEAAREYAGDSSSRIGGNGAQMGRGVVPSPDSPMAEAAATRNGAAPPRHADAGFMQRQEFVHSGQRWAAQRKELGSVEARERELQDLWKRLPVEVFSPDRIGNATDADLLQNKTNRVERENVERALAEAARNREQAEHATAEAEAVFQANKLGLLRARGLERAQSSPPVDTDAHLRARMRLNTVKRPMTAVTQGKTAKTGLEFGRELELVREIYDALDARPEELGERTRRSTILADAARDEEIRRIAGLMEEASEVDSTRGLNSYTRQLDALKKVSKGSTLDHRGDPMFADAVTQARMAGMDEGKIQARLEDVRKLDFSRGEHNAAKLSNGEVVVRPALAFDEKAWARAAESMDATPEAKRRAVAMRIAVRDEIGEDLYGALSASPTFMEWLDGTPDTIRGRARVRVPGRKGQADKDMVSAGELVERFRKEAPDSVQRQMQIGSGAGSAFHGIGKSFWGFLNFLGLPTEDYAEISSEAAQRAARVAEGLGGATWLNKISAGVVNLAPTIGTGGLFQGAGRIARLGQQMVSKGAMRRVLATQGIQSVGSTFMDAKEAGFGSWKARWLGVLNAVPEAVITAAFGKTGAEAIVGLGTSRRGFLNGVKALATGAGMETVEELLVTLAQAPIQKVIDPNHNVGSAAVDTITTAPVLGGGVQGALNLSPGNLKNQLRAMIREMSGDFRSHGTEPVELSAAEAAAKQWPPREWFRVTMGGKLEFVPERIPESYNREILGVATNEELYHAADNDSLHQEYDAYERMGGKDPARRFLTDRAGKIIAQLKTTEQGKQLMLDSLNLYKGRIGQKPEFAGTKGIEKGITMMEPAGFVGELARQLVQFRARGEISEKATYRVADKMHPWVREATNRIGEVARDPGIWSSKLEEAVDRIEAKLKEESRRKYPK